MAFDAVCGGIGGFGVIFDWLTFRSSDLSQKTKLFGPLSKVRLIQAPLKIQTHSSPSQNVKNVDPQIQATKRLKHPKNSFIDYFLTLHPFTSFVFKNILPIPAISTSYKILFLIFICMVTKFIVILFMRFPIIVAVDRLEWA
jgi:hypothetical protein